MADELGVRAVSHQDGLLTTSDGHVQIAFETDSDDVELVCELNCNGGDSASLADCVSRSVADGRRTLFDLSLPGAGEYAVNVFARRKDDPTRLHHVHSYLVTSTQQQGGSDAVTTTLGIAASFLLSPPIRSFFTCVCLFLRLFVFNRITQTLQIKFLLKVYGMVGHNPWT